MRLLRRPEVPGFLLCALLGGSALAAVRALPQRPYLPDVLVALLWGAVVVNTPLRRVLGTRSATELRDTGLYASGLKFVGRSVLRLAVILMGLKIQARFFGVDEVLVMFCAIAAAMPATFLLTHAIAVPLKVPRSLADLIAAGTMICGASAVNAMAPVVGAKKQEQAIALGTVFLFSVVALLLFRPIAALLGIPALDAGLWSGLAVNDLSSAVAVGAQMGPGGAEMAAASKSARVVLLAPLLIVFAVARCGRSAGTDLRKHAVQHLPWFVAGFVALAGARALGDHLFGAAVWWHQLLSTDRTVVDVAMMMVAAGIGLHLDVRGLLTAGSRALLLGAAGSASMAALSLALIVLGKRGGLVGELLLGTIAVAGAYVAFRATHRRAPAPPIEVTPPALPTRLPGETRATLARTISGHVRLPTREVGISTK